MAYESRSHFPTKYPYHQRNYSNPEVNERLHEMDVKFIDGTCKKTLG